MTFVDLSTSRWIGKQVLRRVPDAQDGALYYFLDNEYYFKRPKIYGRFQAMESATFSSPRRRCLPARARLARRYVFVIGMRHHFIFLNDYRR